MDEITSAVELGLGCGFPISDRYFKSAGNRKRYSFRLEIRNGKVVNNISNSAVARDLAHLLLDDPAKKGLLKRKHFFVRMNNNFYCEIYPVKLHRGIMEGRIN